MPIHKDPDYVMALQRNSKMEPPDGISCQFYSKPGEKENEILQNKHFNLSKAKLKTK